MKFIGKEFKVNELFTRKYIRKIGFQGLFEQRVVILFNHNWNVFVKIYWNPIATLNKSRISF